MHLKFFGRRGEFGVEEALLELVMLGVFIVVAFTIVGRAGNSFLAEQELLGLNAQMLFQSLSFHDNIIIFFDFPILPGAKIIVSGNSDSFSGEIIAGFENSSTGLKYNYLKSWSSSSGVSSDVFPFSISSNDGNVGLVGDFRSVNPCDRIARPGSLFLAASADMEDYSRNVFSISPERFSNSQPYIIQSPPSSPSKISGDAFLLLSSSNDNFLRVSINSKSSDIVKSKMYACHYVKFFERSGLSVVIDYKNPDAESDSSIILPSNMPGFEVSMPLSFSESQKSLVIGGVVS